jgi:hypothetical protein
MKAGLVFIALAVFTVCGCGSGGQSAGTTQTAEAESVTADDTSNSSMSFDRDNYDLLMSDPDNYKGASVAIVGKVFDDVERDNKGTYFQMWANPKDSDWNTIVASPDTTLRLSNDDYVRVRGTVKGKFKGENAFGADVLAVTILADDVKKVDATAAASPASKTLPKAQIRQGGIVVTVQKVEFAEDETRVFLAVKNGSDDDFSLYANQGKAISGSRQVEATYSSDYPEPANEVSPGAFTTGVVVYPTMNPNASLRLIFEGYSDDSSIGNYGAVKFQFSWR